MIGTLEEVMKDACKIQKEIQEVAGDNVLVQIGRAGLEVDLNLCPF